MRPDDDAIALVVFGVLLAGMALELAGLLPGWIRDLIAPPDEGDDPPPRRGKL